MTIHVSFAPIPPLSTFLPPRTQALPRMFGLTQQLHCAPLGEANIPAVVAREIGKLKLNLAGKSVAIAAGSRGIASIAVILKALVAEVRALGGQPFLFPAMGSHGGATAEGQTAVLATLGVTESFVGCPIRSSMEVIELGRTSAGLPVYLDKLAAGAGAIIVPNRIKQHTNFHGPVESGLMKMMAIGMGKHAQAIAIHRYGALGLRDHMPEVSRMIMARHPVVAGLAILEDAHHSCSHIEAIAPADIERREAELLEQVRRDAPRLPVDELDLLIVDRIGKNISGTGMDTNVVGRAGLVDVTAWPTPRIRVIIACDLTEETHGSAIGIGLADMTTRRCADKIEWRATYANGVTGLGPRQSALPVIAANDREALRIALDYFVGGIEPEQARIIRIRDTMHLAEMQVSEPLANELRGRAGVTVSPTGAPPKFDAADNLV